MTMSNPTHTKNMAHDGDGYAIQSATKFQCEDATGTTIKSPKTVSSTEIDLLVPTDAVTFVMKPVGADVRVANTDTGTGAAPYYVVKDGTLESFPVASMAAVYLLRDAAVDATVHFRFELVGSA